MSELFRTESDFLQGSLLACQRDYTSVFSERKLSQIAHCIQVARLSRLKEFRSGENLFTNILTNSRMKTFLPRWWMNRAKRPAAICKCLYSWISMRGRILYNFISSCIKIVLTSFGNSISNKPKNLATGQADQGRGVFRSGVLTPFLLLCICLSGPPVRPSIFFFFFPYVRLQSACQSLFSPLISLSSVCS